MPYWRFLVVVNVHKKGVILVLQASFSVFILPENGNTWTNLAEMFKLPYKMGQILQIETRLKVILKSH